MEIGIAIVARAVKCSKVQHGLIYLQYKKVALRFAGIFDGYVAVGVPNVILHCFGLLPVGVKGRRLPDSNL